MSKKTHDQRHGSSKFSRLRLTSKSNDSNAKSEKISKYFSNKDQKSSDDDDDIDENLASATEGCLEVVSENFDILYKSSLKEKYTEFNSAEFTNDEKDFKTPKLINKCKKKNVESSSKPKSKKLSTRNKSKKNPFQQTIKDSFQNLDVNPNHLTLALALSKSEYETEHGVEESNTIEEFPSVLEQQKRFTVKSTLEQFGFNSVKSRISVGNKKKVEKIVLEHNKRSKKSKFLYITPVLILRSTEDRESLIKSKISLILSKNSLLKYSDTFKSNYKLVTKRLQQYECEENKFFKMSSLTFDSNIKDSTFYTEFLNISPTKSKCGVLLKNWNQILGREVSPPREINLNRINAREKNNGSKTPSKTQYENLNSTISNKQNDVNIKKNSNNVSEHKNNYLNVPKINRSISPDLFESDSDDLEHSPIQKVFEKPLMVNNKITVKEKYINSKYDIVKNKNGICHFESYVNNFEDICQSLSLQKTISKIDDFKNQNKQVYDESTYISKDNKLKRTKIDVINISEEDLLDSFEIYAKSEINNKLIENSIGHDNLSEKSLLNKINSDKGVDLTLSSSDEEILCDKELSNEDLFKQILSNNVTIKNPIINTENVTEVEENFFLNHDREIFGCNSNKSENFSYGGSDDSSDKSLLSKTNFRKSKQILDSVLSFSDEETALSFPVEKIVCAKEVPNAVLFDQNISKMNPNNITLKNPIINIENVIEVEKNCFLSNTETEFGCNSNKCENFSDDGSDDSSDKSLLSKTNYRKSKDLTLSSSGEETPVTKGKSKAQTNSKFFLINGTIKSSETVTEVEENCLVNDEEEHYLSKLSKRETFGCNSTKNLNVTDYINDMLNTDYSLNENSTVLNSDVKDTVNHNEAIENPLISNSQETVHLSDEELNYSSYFSTSNKNLKLSAKKKLNYYNLSSDEELLYKLSPINISPTKTNLINEPTETVEISSNDEEEAGAFKNNSPQQQKNLIFNNQTNNFDNYTDTPKLLKHKRVQILQMPSTSQKSSNNTELLDDSFNAILENDEIFNQLTKYKHTQNPTQNLKSGTPEKVEINNSEDVTPNGKIIMKTSNITPMANYDEMNTPLIVKELNNYGLKPMKRQRGAKLLKYIYEKTHPLVGNASDECSTDEEGDKRVVKKLRQIGETEGITDDPNHDYGNVSHTCKLSHKSHLGNIELVGDIICPNIAEEDLIFERRISSKIPSCRIPLDIAWYNFVSANQEIKKNILLYEPLHLDVLHSMFKDLGFKFHIQDLLTFLDRKCITIRTAQNQSRRTKK